MTISTTRPKPSDLTLGELPQARQGTALMSRIIVDVAGNHFYNGRGPNTTTKRLARYRGHCDHSLGLLWFTDRSRTALKSPGCMCALEVADRRVGLSIYGTTGQERVCTARSSDGSHSPPLRSGALKRRCWPAGRIMGAAVKAAHALARRLAPPLVPGLVIPVCNTRDISGLACVFPAPATTGRRCARSRGRVVLHARCQTQRSAWTYAYRCIKTATGGMAVPAAETREFSPYTIAKLNARRALHQR